mmetsp:Transcript_27141/g.60062  ORF Transcript_27141/g.60062 Transcript_27141/m.60062 type:complete len:257 (+) Transcript_27141:120-890(+)
MCQHPPGMTARCLHGSNIAPDSASEQCSQQFLALTAISEIVITHVRHPTLANFNSPCLHDSTAQDDVGTLGHARRRKVGDSDFFHLLFQQARDRDSCVQNCECRSATSRNTLGLGGQHQITHVTPHCERHILISVRCCQCCQHIRQIGLLLVQSKYQCIARIDRDHFAKNLQLAWNLDNLFLADIQFTGLNSRSLDGGGPIHNESSHGRNDTRRLVSHVDGSRSCRLRTTCTRRRSRIHAFFNFRQLKWQRIIAHG